MKYWSVPASLVAVIVYCPWSSWVRSVMVRLSLSSEKEYLDPVDSVIVSWDESERNFHIIFDGLTDGEALSITNVSMMSLYTIPSTGEPDGNLMVGGTKGRYKDIIKLWKYNIFNEICAKHFSKSKMTRKAVKITVHVYECVHVHKHVHIHIHAHVCIHTHVHIHIHVHTTHQKQIYNPTLSYN